MSRSHEGNDMHALHLMVRWRYVRAGEWITQ